jgi:hypothetical protein
MKPDSASATAAEERIIRQAEEIIRRLEEKNTMLRLKLYLVRMEKMITSRCRHLRRQSNDVVSRMEEKIETAGKRWGNNTFTNLRRD